MTTEERENKRLQVRAGSVEDRGSEGQRGLFHRSCIVNEKFFTVQILFLCKTAEKAS